jgi:hypothetical protein
MEARKKSLEDNQAVMTARLKEGCPIPYQLCKDKIETVQVSRQTLWNKIKTIRDKLHIRLFCLDKKTKGLEREKLSSLIDAEVGLITGTAGFSTALLTSRHPLLAAPIAGLASQFVGASANEATIKAAVFAAKPEVERLFDNAYTKKGLVNDVVIYGLVKCLLQQVTESFPAKR